MLPRASRIRKPGEFSRIYKSGRRASANHLRIFFARGRNTASRFGFVISKKSAKVSAAAGKIVQRNRLKRILRAEIRALAPALSPGYDIVIQVREGLAKLSAADVRAELREALAKTTLLKQ